MTAGDLHDRAETLDIATRTTVPELLEAMAQSRTGATAVATPEESLTYGEVLRCSTDAAAQLLTMGVRKGTVVALLLPNGIEWVRWWAACAQIGAIVVPINTFAKPDEVRRVLEHSGAQVFVSTPAFANSAYRDDLEVTLGIADPTVDRFAPELPQLRRVAWTDRVSAATPTADTRKVVDALAADVVAADTLTIIYSSGSTGDPKGVVHSHGATMRQATKLAALTRTTSSTVLWTSMPMNWVGGLVWSFLRTFVAGGTFVTQERFVPGDALRLFRETGVDTVTAWGPGFDQLRNDPEFDPEEFGHIPGLGSTPIFDPSRPSALGMTETLGPHSGWFGTLEDEPPAGSAGSLGQALPGMERRIVDPESGTDVPDGTVGEILVRGDALMRGLHRREREDTFTADGWYRTRDAGSLTDGWLFFHGRLDEMIKTAGANVSPAEVIAVLQDRPDVRQAFVVGVPDAERGEEVTAFVVAEADAAVDLDALRAAARTRLASYKVPRRMYVVGEDELPWLSSQKIDLRQLRTMAITLGEDS